MALFHLPLQRSKIERPVNLAAKANPAAVPAGWAAGALGASVLAVESGTALQAEPSVGRRNWEDAKRDPEARAFDASGASWGGSLQEACGS